MSNTAPYYKNVVRTYNVLAWIVTIIICAVMLTVAVSKFAGATTAPTPIPSVSTTPDAESRNSQTNPSTPPSLMKGMTITDSSGPGME